MAMPVLPLRRAMTLVELLVVIVIIGLLGVAVAPLFQARSERRKFVEAGGIVSAHFNAVIARSIGSVGGEGAWLPVDTTATPNTVTTLGFTRSRSTPGSLTVTAITSGIATVGLNPAPPTPTGMTGPTGLVHVAGFPVPYELESPTPTDHFLRFLPGYSAENAAFPAENQIYDFRASIPPQQRITATARELGGGFCVDLTASTIGVHGLTDPSQIVSLNGVDTLAVMFDSMGKATMVWREDAAASPRWQWTMLDGRRPVALLIGQSFRTTLPVVDQPTDENPGPNLQSPDAVWVVIDPRASLVRTAANDAVPNTSVPVSARVAYAQQFVLEALTK